MICRGLGLIISSSIFFTACYSLKGISIPPAIETFYIDQFQNRVSNAPADVGQRFADEFRILVNDGTRLKYDEGEPDIEFSGAIQSFRVQSVAPERNSNDGQVQFGSTLNRLTIAVQVEYVSNEDEEDNWTQSFSFFEDFENDVVLEDVQDQLIDNIFEQILQDIYTKAFTNW